MGRNHFFLPELESVRTERIYASVSTCLSDPRPGDLLCLSTSSHPLGFNFKHFLQQNFPGLKDNVRSPCCVFLWYLAPSTSPSCYEMYFIIIISSATQFFKKLPLRKACIFKEIKFVFFQMGKLVRDICGPQFIM